MPDNDVKYSYIALSLNDNYELSYKFPACLYTKKRRAGKIQAPNSNGFKLVGIWYLFFGASCVIFKRTNSFVEDY